MNVALKPAFDFARRVEDLAAPVPRVLSIVLEMLRNEIDSRCRVAEPLIAEMILRQRQRASRAIALERMFDDFVAFDHQISAPNEA